MDLINIRRVAWGIEKRQDNEAVDSSLVEVLVAKIMERLR
jgi:hypothetical protein